MRMTVNSLKNFFKCLVYIFVPLGCIFLGFLCGVQLLLNEIAVQADYIGAEVSALIDGTEVQIDNLLGFIVSSLRELDWNQPLRTVAYLLQGDWIASRLAEFLQLTVEEATSLKNEVVEIANHTAEALKARVVTLFVCVVIGVVAGYFVTNYFVRKSTVRRGFWGFWIAAVTDAVLTATLVAFVTWLLTVSHAGAIVSGFAGALVFGFIALSEAYLLHGRGKIPFKQVVNFKNCLFVCLAQLAVIAVAAVICTVILLITRSVVAIALVISVVIIALLVINVNAESYVSELAKDPSAFLRKRESKS